MSETTEAPVVKRSAFKRWAQRLVIATVLYALAGFFGVPALIEWQLPKQASKQLGRVVTLAQARFNPFTLQLTLSDLHIAEIGDWSFRGSTSTRRCCAWCDSRVRATTGRTSSNA